MARQREEDNEYEDPPYQPPYYPDEPAVDTHPPAGDKPPTDNPNPTPTPAPGPTPYSDEAFQTILRKYPPSLSGRQQALAEANKTFGLNLTWFGSKSDKIRLPDGRVMDVVMGSGTSNPQWGWLDTASENAPGVDPNAPDFAVDPSYLDPWTGKPPDRPPSDPFTGPGDFVQPTGDDILKDPSFLWRVGQGRGALENSAAAKGLLNSGGTLADILNYGQQAASQEYGSVWDRAFGAWNSKWSNALDTYRTNQNTVASDYDRAWQQYLDQKDTWYQNQDRPFDKLSWAAGQGAGAAR